MSSVADEVQTNDFATTWVDNKAYIAVAETIRQRRTIKQFLPQPISPSGVGRVN